MMVKEESMMSDSKANATTTEKKEPCLEFSLQSASSTLEVMGGNQIPFSRAILSLRNTGQKAVVGVVPHATVTQEGMPVHDRTEALSRAGKMESIPPGDEVVWDVYDLLLAEADGVASKIHLFGYKAVLNWWYELAVWAEYRLPDSATPEQTPVARLRLRWFALDPPHNNIDVTIEVVEG
jgi:hypothetical protein